MGNVDRSFCNGPQASPSEVEEGMLYFNKPVCKHEANFNKVLRLLEGTTHELDTVKNQLQQVATETDNKIDQMFQTLQKDIEQQNTHFHELANFVLGLAKSVEGSAADTRDLLERFDMKLSGLFAGRESQGRESEDTCVD